MQLVYYSSMSEFFFRPSPPHRKHNPDVPLSANKLQQSCVCLCNNEGLWASHQQPPPALLPLTPLFLGKKDLPGALPPLPSLLWIGGWYLIGLSRWPSPPATASLIAAEEISRAHVTVYLSLMFHCKHSRDTKLLEACFSAFLWVITHIFVLWRSPDRRPGDMNVSPAMTWTISYMSACTPCSSVNMHFCHFSGKHSSIVLTPAAVVDDMLQHSAFLFYQFSI